MGGRRKGALCLAGLSGFPGRGERRKPPETPAKTARKRRLSSQSTSYIFCSVAHREMVSVSDGWGAKLSDNLSNSASREPSTTMGCDDPLNLFFTRFLVIIPHDLPTKDDRLLRHKIVPMIPPARFAVPAYIFSPCFQEFFVTNSALHFPMHPAPMMGCQVQRPFTAPHERDNERNNSAHITQFNALLFA